MIAELLGRGKARARTVTHRCPVLFKTRKPGFHFFGYYDISPIDASGTKLLTHRVQTFDRMPRADDVVELGMWNLESGGYEKLAETRAYNWQQGSKLQWLGPDFETRVIFNDREDDRFVTRILDVATGDLRTLPFPVYTVNPNGKAAICTNFERSYFPREGYSYQGIVKPEWNVPLHPDDGLFRLDLETGDLERILATSDLVEHQPLSSMEGAPHYLEHAMYNPDGSRFVFLHRWQLPSGATYDRAYTADEDGGRLHLLLDSSLFSHCGWRTPNELTAWAKMPSTMGALRRHRALTKFVLAPLLPIYRRLLSPNNRVRAAIGGGNYVHMVDRSDQRHILAPSVPWPGDGHCSWHPHDKRWMLTDTYQDESFDRHLFIYDHQDGRRIEIGRFHSPPSTCNTGYRCDLHPRWDRSGTRVIIDSMHEDDERQVYVLDVSGVVGGG